MTVNHRKRVRVPRGTVWWGLGNIMVIVCVCKTCSMGSNPIPAFTNLRGGMVDAEDLKSSIVKCEGSSPSVGRFLCMFMCV